MTVKLALATVPLFQFLPAEELKRVAALGKIVEKGKGSLILMRGEPVLGIYLLAEGVVGVHATRPERLIAELRSGESFGEMSYLENTKASATIRAEEAGTKLILFLHTDLRLLIERDPLIGRCLFQGIALQLSKKLRATTDRLAIEFAADNDLSQQVLTSAKGHTESGGALLTQIGEFQRFAADQLDESLKTLEELAKKIPDKPGSLNDLHVRLTDLRAKAKTFLPTLGMQVGAMSRTLERLGELASQPAE